MEKIRKNKKVKETYSSASSVQTRLSFSRSILFPAIAKQIPLPNIFLSSVTQFITCEMNVNIGYKKVK